MKYGMHNLDDDTLIRQNWTGFPRRRSCDGTGMVTW